MSSAVVDKIVRGSMVTCVVPPLGMLAYFGSCLIVGKSPDNRVMETFAGVGMVTFAAATGVFLVGVACNTK